MTSMHGGDVVIARAAETDQVGKLPGHLMLALHAEAARNALADAGLTPADVDGLAVAEPEAIEVAHHLGVTPQWLGGTNMGGGSFLLHVRHAAAAIAADVALITHGELGSRPRRFSGPIGLVCGSSPSRKYASIEPVSVLGAMW
jgi:acetyl-CoA acetyltransferase